MGLWCCRELVIWKRRFSNCKKTTKGSVQFARQLVSFLLGNVLVDQVRKIDLTCLVHDAVSMQQYKPLAYKWGRGLFFYSFFIWICWFVSRFFSNWLLYLFINRFSVFCTFTGNEILNGEFLFFQNIVNANVNLQMSWFALTILRSCANVILRTTAWFTVTVLTRWKPCWMHWRQELFSWKTGTWEHGLLLKQRWRREKAGVIWHLMFAHQCTFLSGYSSPIKYLLLVYSLL